MSKVELTVEDVLSSIRVLSSIFNATSLKDAKIELRQKGLHENSIMKLSGAVKVAVINAVTNSMQYDLAQKDAEVLNSLPSIVGAPSQNTSRFKPMTSINMIQHDDELPLGIKTDQEITDEVREKAYELALIQVLKAPETFIFSKQDIEEKVTEEPATKETAQTSSETGFNLGFGDGMLPA